jgi:hypothetical protein
MISKEEINNLSPLIFSIALVSAIREIQENQDNLELDGRPQLLVRVEYINFLDVNICRAINKDRSSIRR